MTIEEGFVGTKETAHRQFVKPVIRCEHGAEAIMKVLNWKSLPSEYVLWCVFAHVFVSDCVTASA